MMEGAQFYLHLPSNASLDKFSNNTLTEYRVCLPQTTSLTGEWEVALTEIHYPHSWNNIQGNFENRFYLRNQELDGMWEPLIVPPGYYSSVADLITKFNEVVRASGRFKDEMQLSFNTLNRKVTVHKIKSKCIFPTSGKRDLVPRVFSLAWGRDGKRPWHRLVTCPPYTLKSWV